MNNNIIYGKFTPDGKVNINGTTYVIERDFYNAILFLRIESNSLGYHAMLSIKTRNNISVSLFNQFVHLNISDHLLNQSRDFQQLRRRSDEPLRGIGFLSHSPEQIEANMATAIYETFFSEGSDIGTVCHDFLDQLQKGKLSELLLVISTQEVRIQNLPWEMVLPRLTREKYDLPRNNFGLIRSCEISLENFNLQGISIDGAPLKMLFIPALPENLSERNKLLEVEDEQRKIIQSVRTLEVTGDQEPKLVLDILDCADLTEIKQALQSKSHDIVHISGHGKYMEDINQGMLYLENEEGDLQRTSGYELGKVLKEFSSIKLLVLSACETAVGGKEGSVAEQVATMGLPAVLAMRFSVTDLAARLFTEKLYERLAYGDSLTKAMHDARQKLWDLVQKQRESASQHLTRAEWFTPVLYQNQHIGPIVSIEKYNSAILNRFYPKPAFLKGVHTRFIGDGFIGRKRLLIQLRKSFVDGKHICLHGLGGLGKTTTVEAFAHQYHIKQGSSIIMFRNRAEIQEAIILERILEWWTVTVKPEEYLSQQIKNKLSLADLDSIGKLQLIINNCLQDHSTIIIFDNFEDVQTEINGLQTQKIVSPNLTIFLQYLLKNAPIKTCHILFTTRYRITDLENLITHLPIDKMSYAEQYRFINFSQTLRRIPINEREIIDRRIDGHPRALEFLEGLLRNDKDFNINKFDASIGVVESEIFNNLLLERLYNQLNDIEREIFEAASVFFGRNSIDVLSAVIGKEVKSLRPILYSLLNWSLCIWDEQNQTFEVHTLTRTWLRQMNKPDSSKFKIISQTAGEYFNRIQSIGTWFLAKDYFEQCENWEEYASTALNIQSYFQVIGLYLSARDINLEIIQQDISPKIKAQALNNLGNVYKMTGDYQAAISHLLESVQISKNINDKSAESTSLSDLGVVYFILGERSIAFNYLENGLLTSKELKDENSEAIILGNLSQFYIKSGDFEKGLEYASNSLELNKKNNNLLGLGASLDAIGQIYYAKGEYDKALDYQKDSLIIHRETGNRHGEATSLTNLSHIYLAKGDIATVLSYLNKSLQIYQEIGDKQGEGAALNSLGTAYSAQGNSIKALEYYKKTLTINEQIGDKAGIANALYNIGTAYSNIFNDSLAIDYLNQSLKINKEISNKHGEIFCLIGIGKYYYHQKLFKNALSAYEKALENAKLINTLSDQGTILNSIGEVYYAQGDFNKALKFYTESYKVSRQTKNLYSLAIIQTNLGELYCERFKDYNKAIPLLIKSYNFLRSINSPNTSKAGYYLSQIEMKIGKGKFSKIVQSIKGEI